MVSIEELVSRLSQINWLDFGRSAFSVLSCLTVMFAFYILYFDRSVFAFISAFSYLNFIFFTSILLTVSFGMARLLLFFMEHYIIPLFESLALLVVSVLAIFIGKFAARARFRMIKSLGLKILHSANIVQDMLEGARKLSRNPVAPFILGAFIFLVVFLEGTAPKGAVAVSAIFILGYFVFSLNLAYGAPTKPENPEFKEESDKSFVSILRSTAEDLLSAQRELTDGITRSILLQQKLTDIYPVLFDTQNMRTFLVRFWGLIFLVASAALGYLRGEIVESSSRYTVALIQTEREGGSTLLDVSVFLTANSAILAKEATSGDVLVLPYDAIGALTSQGTSTSFSSGFSGGRF